LTVNELQLFVQFGQCFGNNYFALKDKVFALLSLSDGNQSRILIIFMTATATTTILEQASLLTGLTFCLWNIFWPGPTHTLQHSCQIEFFMALQPSSILTSLADKLYKAMDGDAVWHQSVVFANFCCKAKEFSTQLNAYLDLKEYTGNVITIVSTQYKEQHMHHVTFFLNDTPNHLHPVNNGIFNAIACWLLTQLVQLGI
jgi:hypothetical protein